MPENSEIRLSPQQQKAVAFGEGALLVVAGPGSGKTRVLTERVRRLLRDVEANFRILALTFTNKAANEMRERLKEIPDVAARTFIGTLHSFCTDVLTTRGEAVGIKSLPFIFESYSDRRQILIEAVNAEPELAEALRNDDVREQSKQLEQWMRRIVWIKSHPVSCAEVDDVFDRLLLDAYDAALRANGGVDFEDLLSLTYRLFIERPKIADFYRRLYRYICIDEAQDLNEAQYSVLRALCGDHYRNVMMVGDPKQSVYGFNTSDPKYMLQFQQEFAARKIELTDNFRSSRAVVSVARLLEPHYEIRGQLPIAGAVKVLTGEDETDEAQLVANTIGKLIRNGHPDIEGPVTFDRCAILGRTRYSLLSIENELRSRDWPFHKQLSANYESSSDLVKDFDLALHILVNPLDALHTNMLAKRWQSGDIREFNSGSGIEVVERIVKRSHVSRAKVILSASREISRDRPKLNMMAALDVLESQATSPDSRVSEEERRAIWEDVKVWKGEWDRYLRTVAGQQNLATFLSCVALGTTQQPKQEGLGLITVHSAKGLEFDVVFIMGMTDGTFPDYRARGNAAAIAEERRVIFVAVTRSRRLLYMSYPKTKEMPWGEEWQLRPSPYLSQMRLL